MPRNRIGHVNLVAELGQPQSIRAAATAGVDDNTRRRRQTSLHEATGAIELNQTKPARQSRLLVGSLVVRNDLRRHVAKWSSSVRPDICQPGETPDRRSAGRR